MDELVAWAERLGLTVLPPRDGDLLNLADLESGYSIGAREGLFAVELSTLEHTRELIGAFDRVEDARRMLALELGARLRRRQGLSTLHATELARGFGLEHIPIALWLTWDEGAAEFPPDEPGRLRARDFSRVADASVGEIRRAFEDSEGGVLFG